MLVAVTSVAGAQSHKYPGVDAARAAALRQCNAKAEKYTIYTWGEVQLQVYRACMAEHHQPE
jgi:hypothetical protein